MGQVLHVLPSLGPLGCIFSESKWTPSKKNGRAWQLTSVCVNQSPFQHVSKGSFSELIFKVSRQGETAFDYIYTYLLCPMKLGNQVGSRSWWFLRTCSESTIFNFSTCIMARWPNQKPPMSFTAKQGLHGNFPELNRVIHHRRLAVFQVCVCIYML